MDACDAGAGVVNVQMAPLGDLPKLRRRKLFDQCPGRPVFFSSQDAHSLSWASGTNGKPP